MHKEIILQVQDLKKYFGAVHAVDGVSLKRNSGSDLWFSRPEWLW